MRRKRMVVFVLALALAIVLTSFSISFAEAGTGSTAATPAVFNDVGRHWAKDAIYKWSQNKVINGYAGSFRPNDSITRGEMAVILDNMMDYQAIAKNTFIDLKERQFYTEPIRKANAAGIIRGDGSHVRPTDKITREEAAVMLARAFAVNTSTNGVSAFNDGSSISSWAKGYVTAMEAEGYIKGTNHNFLPKNKVTRAEIVTMIDNIVKAYYTEAGIYTEDVQGTAVVKVTGVILKGAEVSENLIVAEGVGEGDVTLDSVTVKGNTVIRGGGENSVHIIGTSDITSIRVEKNGGMIRVVISDGSTIQEMAVAAGERIIITGTVGALNITASDVVVNVEDAKIKSTNISGSNVVVETAAKPPTGSRGSSVPVISSVSIAGKAVVGSTLTANPIPTAAAVTYQWKRADAADGLYTNIEAASETYSLTPEDQGKYIKVYITGTGTYTGVRTSDAAGPIMAQPVMAGTVIIDGVTKYNETLNVNLTGITYTPDTGDNVPAFQWKRSGTDIMGETGETYLLEEDDIGGKISVTVTADGTNATGAGITSTETAAILKADELNTPESPTLASKTHHMITLAAIQGAEYRMDGGSWQSSSVYTGLTPETAYSFTARIKETNTHNASAESSAAEIETAVFPVMEGTVVINGTAKYNETLTADTTGITYTPDTSSNVLSYQWKRGGADITGATGENYLLAEDDIGELITVTVIPDGVNATGAGITSAGTAAIAKADGPSAPSAPALASKTHWVITLAAMEGVEYRIDGGSWQSSPVFTDLTPETAYGFTVRIKETNTHNASAESSAAEIETAVFPVMEGTVVINGTAKYNETLTADTTGITYMPDTSSNVLSYQWKRGGADIAGATGEEYLLVGDDIGELITVTVIPDGVNATGTGITSAGTAAIAKADGPNAPSAPTLLSKNHNTITLATIFGAEYRVNGGEWQSSAVFTGLSAETAYTFTARIKETTTHNASAESSVAEIVTGVFPVMGGTVTIDGTTGYFKTLTANITGLTYMPSTSSNVPKYQWMRDGAVINGATGNTYFLVQADIGRIITVTVTPDGISNATGSGITSPATAAIGKADRPAPAAPILLSKKHNTVTLTTISQAEYRANGGTWQPSPIFTGLTAETVYNFTARIKESATYNASAESSPTAIQTDVFPVMGGTVTIDGTATYDQTLTVNFTGLTYTPDTSSNVPRYQWKRSGSDISGATGSTYKLAEADIGNTITVTVTPDGTNATGAAISSAETSAVAKADRSAPAAPTLAAKSDTSITLTAVDGAEYRMDNGEWDSSPVFIGLTPRSLHSFTVRISETGTHNASAESEPLIMTTATNSTTTDILGVDIKMLYAPGGTFPTGTGGTSSTSEFWMSETEVTYELWYAVRMWAEGNGYTFWVPGMEGSVTGGGNHVSNYPNKGKPPTAASQEPVTLITTYDMMVWLNALSELTGRAPVYYYTLNESTYIFKSARDAGLIAENKVTVSYGNNGYRLPTRGQWEYAARWKGADSSNGSIEAGGQYWSPWSFASGATADEANAIGEVAWYSSNTSKTQPVGQKKPNGLGFYDMSGNVWEVNYVNSSPGSSRFVGGSIYSGSSTVGAGNAFTLNNDSVGVTIEGTDIGFRIAVPELRGHPEETSKGPGINPGPFRLLTNPASNDSMS